MLSHVFFHRLLCLVLGFFTSWILQGSINSCLAADDKILEIRFSDAQEIEDVLNGETPLSDRKLVRVRGKVSSSIRSLFYTPSIIGDVNTSTFSIREEDRHLIDQKSHVKFFYGHETGTGFYVLKTDAVGDFFFTKSGKFYRFRLHGCIPLLEMIVAQNQLSDRTRQILNKTLRLSKEKDSFAAFAHLESNGTPEEVVTWYSSLVRVCYFQEKNVPLMTMFGRRGIQFGLEQARHTDSDELANKLKSTAKEICYNVGVNMWPAWEDEGITVTPSDLAIGLDAARTNLRLAIELKRDAIPMTDAHWLVGAQLLAARKTKLAGEQFKQAAEIAKQANLTDREWMAKGYLAIVQQLDEDTKPAGDEALQTATKKLRDLETEDAKFWADQLKSVSQFFRNKP